MTDMTTLRTEAEIIADLQAAGATRDREVRLYNEGATDGFADEARIEHLYEELRIVQAANSPLATCDGIIAERNWAAAQCWTGKDLAKANTACKERGYSLAELQAAIKTL